MKIRKINLIVSFCLLTTLFVLAQSTDVKPYKKPIVPTLDNRHAQPIIINSKEYDSLKSSGLLYRYELSTISGKAQLRTLDFSKPQNKPQARTANSNVLLTECMPPGYPEGTNAWSPSIGVDDAVTLVAIPFSFCFYGNQYNSCSVGTNGNIQFGTPTTNAFSSTGFPIPLPPNPSYKMLAPFWADCVIGANNTVTATVPILGQRYGKVRVDVFATKMIVIWDSISYYRGGLPTTQLLNSFACILTEGTDQALPTGKNVCFHYKRMEWTTGNASGGTDGFGGTAATVGANAGDGVTFYQIGRFIKNGFDYYGNSNTPPFNGVSWLTGKRFNFNTCAAQQNVEPIALGLVTDCDTVCISAPTTFKESFLGPEINQIVNVNVSCATMPVAAFTGIYTYGNGSTDAHITINPQFALPGYYTIQLSATDNGSPAQTTVKSFVVLILNGSIPSGTIVTTPTSGLCIGGVFTASLVLPPGFVVNKFSWNDNSVTQSNTFTIGVNTLPNNSIYCNYKINSCQTTIYGQVPISPQPFLNILGNYNYCDNLPNTTLTVSNIGGGNQGNTTYTWSSITSTTQPTSPNSSVVTVVAGIYSITAQNMHNCKATNTLIITKKEAPNYLFTTNANYQNYLYCPGIDSALIKMYYGSNLSPVCGLKPGATNCANSQTVVSSTTNSVSSVINVNPFVSLYKTSRHQYLFRAIELTSRGLKAGKISAIAFNYSSSPPFIINQFPGTSVGIKCTNNLVATNNFDLNTSFSNVYTGNLTINNGITIIPFSTPYLWDGISNILIDICHGPIFAGNLANPQALYSNTSYQSTTYYADDVSSCGKTTGSATNMRPNIVFYNCEQLQSPSQFSFSLTPSSSLAVNNSIVDQVKIKVPPQGSAPITFTLNVTNTVTGCTNNKEIKIQSIPTVVNISVTPLTSTICEGQDVTLTSFGDATGYMWYFKEILNSNTISTTPIITVKPNPFLNIYHAVGTLSCNGYPITPGSASLSVYVKPKAILDIKLPKDFTKCQNTTVQVTSTITSLVEANDGKPHSQNWLTLPGPVLAPGVNNQLTYSFESNANETTLIFVATGVCAYPASNTITIKNYPDNAVLNIVPPFPDSLCTNVKMNWYSQIVNGIGPVSFKWFDTKPSQIGTSQNIETNAPSGYGAHTYTVTSTDSCGYFRMATKTISIKICSLKVPNILTVNDDGINDALEIEGILARPNTSLQIFDKWGHKIFETTNYKNGDWKPSKDMISGIYYYVCNAPGDKVYTGFITLVK